MSKQVHNRQRCNVHDRDASDIDVVPADISCPSLTAAARIPVASTAYQAVSAANGHATQLHTTYPERLQLQVVCGCLICLLCSLNEKLHSKCNAWHSPCKHWMWMCYPAKKIAHASRRSLAAPITCLLGGVQVRNRWTELSQDEQQKVLQLAYQHMKDGERPQLMAAHVLVALLPGSETPFGLHGGVQQQQGTAADVQHGAFLCVVTGELWGAAMGAMHQQKACMV